MIRLPHFLKRFQQKAQNFITLGLAKDIEFSGKTYQVLVGEPDSDQEDWAFLQLDDQGRLKDSFCSCAASEEGRPCIHQAVAFLYIYHGHSLPLNQRFERSLWNHLCFQCADLLGNQVNRIKKNDEGHYVSRTANGKEVFSFHGKSPEMIKHVEMMFFQRQDATEETSLKFSNLSQEEITLWHQGKPSSQFSYELSFWSDLAKWLFTLQEAKTPYHITFKSSGNKLPNAISVTFPEFSVQWVLFKDSLPTIIPSFTTVESPLKVHDISGEIEKIIYDDTKKELILVHKQKKKMARLNPKGIKGIEVGSWTYISGDGFYSNDRSFLMKIIQQSDVENFLEEHAESLKELMPQNEIHTTPTTVSYAISFDSQWNMHIEEYVFTPGDLDSQRSDHFGSWVYLENKGFYRLEDRYFQDVATDVKAENVPDFVSEHRTWLNTQEGFSTHLNTLEGDLTYHLDPKNNLIFSRDTTFRGDRIESKDFGRWSYVLDHGFFPKESAHTLISIKVGTTISADRIGDFIRIHQDELQLVKDFFSHKCPVSKIGLDIRLTEQDEVEVTPQYELLPEYRDKHVKFYDHFTYCDGEGFFELPYNMRLPERYSRQQVIDEEYLPTFINEDLPLLSSFISKIDPRLIRSKQGALLAEDINRENRQEKSGFALKLVFQTEFGSISVASLWSALQQKKRFVFTEAGLFDLNERRYHWLNQLAKGRVDKRSNVVFLTALELLRLDALESVSVTLGKDQEHKRTRQLLSDLTNFHVPEEPDLIGLKSHLRSYQQLGVNWLWFLYFHGLSGLLCDDMGLGKTHQAMALIMAIANHYRKQGDKTKRHYLIVCPTSVIYHWQEKLSEFLPELKVWTFYGANRSLDSFYQDCDILLTSYGIFRNESDQLSSLTFELAIFDELQIAKNQTSRIYHALLKAKARMRLGLTGTPIENRLRELKTLFDIVLPTYMPNESDYREFFVHPIEKEGNLERKQLLGRLIKPFVLRRKKEDVLLDLPEKIEEIAHCDLLSEQRKLYSEVLLSAKNKILDELHDDSAPIPYIHIFALLSHLKQICDHPAAFLKKPAEYKHYHSGKWNLFVELLEEARESQQKVVVFSQYLAMLDIIEDYLREHHIGFATIRGATVNRGEQLQRFNNDPKCEVFVASLQAAGLGVDLTAASVVIHYDRWWNAARENQATDRVHRIGQTRGVQVFKLMTKGTIEEHIDFLIAKKGKLMDEVVSVDDHQIIKKIDRQEMINLLQTMPVM